MQSAACCQGREAACRQVGQYTEARVPSGPVSHQPSVWAVIKASALSRLGRPLLLTYLALLVFGVLVVLGSLLVMRFG